MWGEDARFSTIRRDSQPPPSVRLDAPLPPIPTSGNVEEPSIPSPHPNLRSFDVKSTVRNFSSSSAELSFLSQQLSQYDSPATSNEWDFDETEPPLPPKTIIEDDKSELASERTVEGAVESQEDRPGVKTISEELNGGLKRSGSIAHPKVQIPRYVRQSFSSRPIDLPGSPLKSARPSSPTDMTPPSISVVVESPDEKPKLLPKVALRRSDTLPKFPPEPPKKSQSDNVDKDFDSLPSNPKSWTPTHVGIYLTHVLKLVPKPLVDDVRAFVTSSSMGGRSFLRMKEVDLRELGINQNWVRIISSAREKLRREVLAGKIWGGEEDDNGLDGAEPTPTGAGLGVPESARDTWQKSWRRAKGSKSKGRVKGMAQDFETVKPEDRPDSPLSQVRAEEARLAISQGWKERRRRKKKTTLTTEAKEDVSGPAHPRVESVSSSSDISFEDDAGTRSVIRRRTESFSSIDSDVSTSSVEFSDMETSETGFADMMASRFLNKPLEGIDFAFSMEETTTPKEEPKAIEPEPQVHQDADDLKGLSPAMAALLAPVREERGSDIFDIDEIPSIPSSIRSANVDFTCPSPGGSYQSRFVNHQNNGVNPYEKIPQNAKKRSSLFLGSGFSKGSIRGLPKSEGSRFTVEELLEMDGELSQIQEEVPFAQDDERITMKKVGTGSNEADGKTKTVSASSTRLGTLSRRHHIKDIFGPLVEVPISELEQETSSSSDPPTLTDDDRTAAAPPNSSLSIFDEKGGDQKGSVMLVRKSHLRKLEAKLAELEAQVANTSDSQSDRTDEPILHSSRSHNRSDSLVSNSDDVVALVPAETASRYSSLKGKEPKEWFLAQADPEEASEEEVTSPKSQEETKTLQKKDPNITMGWSELGSFCLAASAGIGVVIGQVVFSKLLRK